MHCENEVQADFFKNLMFHYYEYLGDTSYPERMCLEANTCKKDNYIRVGHGYEDTDYLMGLTDTPMFRHGNYSTWENAYQFLWAFRSYSKGEFCQIDSSAFELLEFSDYDWFSYKSYEK